jgi:hypothetical protein
MTIPSCGIIIISSAFDLARLMLQLGQKTARFSLIFRR